MGKVTDNSGIISAADGDSLKMNRLVVRRTMSVCEEETVFDYISNEYMQDRLSQYLYEMKKRR